MNKLDPHTLFSIFEQGDEQVYKEHNVLGVLDNPYVLIGMAVTGVENFALIDQMYLLRYAEDYAKVRSKIKYNYYTKLYTYLTRVKLDELGDEYKVGEDYEISRSIDAILDIQIYFQQSEEYEKCKVIKQFSDLLIDLKLQTLI
tara:strand:- start:7067 stop:7498 length:432 start_codon:yes stop_codon:yes gene_type:complete